MGMMAALDAGFSSLGESNIMTIWGIISALGYLLTLVLIRWVLLMKKRQPASTIAWILAIVALPFLGGVLFLFFGINRVDRRVASKQQDGRTIVKPRLEQDQATSGDALNDQQRRLMRLAGRISESVPTFGNKIELLIDTNRTLGLIEQAILSAQESLHLEYYIWQPDRTGTRMRDLLVQKAKEGVTVRFLYDGIGSMRLSKRFLQPMREAGIHVASFLPGATWRQRWSLNLRNHRKIVIVDGKTGFTGGMNVGDEYLGKNPHLGYWRDTHLKLLGPAVLQLQHIFVEDWYYATGEKLTQPEIFPRPEEPGDVSAQVLAGQPTAACASA